MNMVKLLCTHNKSTQVQIIEIHNDKPAKKLPHTYC